MTKIPVGVSECLLGEPVRYNGGHKHFRYLTRVLSDYLELYPACPEVAIGLGVPRDPIHLLATDKGTRVVGAKDHGFDVTEPLAAEAERVADTLPQLCGYILMQKSPSCGVYNIKRYRSNGYPQDNDGRGAFAARLMERMPLLPVEEAGRLNDPALRENFITRVFAYHDFQQSVGDNPKARVLIDFWSRYKYLVMAHHPESYRAIGRLLADLSGPDLRGITAELKALLMTALSKHAGRKGHTNTLMHLRGYLREQLDSDEREELGDVIEAYRSGEVPLVVPMTLLKHYLRKVDFPYLEQQRYWAPYPDKLGLRNVSVD
ncbi:YbgA family protein [Marinimicrobium alkaliphilum]|uniref:YbgA family protein n=1 Tax=Marinimicrobium alkaliphilum TaxID=2202654 RepID=UPI000DBAA2D6|nr:DUF523 and DUF1722 domain-containing protein [Marinimicrobium alkaliphilum]